MLNLIKRELYSSFENELEANLIDRLAIVEMNRMKECNEFTLIIIKMY